MSSLSVLTLVRLLSSSFPLLYQSHFFLSSFLSPSSSMFPGALAICPVMPVYEAILGTNVSLGVFVSGQPPVNAEEIDWRDPRDQRILNASIFAHQMLADNNRTLHIQDVGVSDAGIYRINLSKRIIGNNFLNVTASIELNVIGKCHISSLIQTVSNSIFVRVCEEIVSIIVSLHQIYQGDIVIHLKFLFVSYNYLTAHTFDVSLMSICFSIQRYTIASRQMYFLFS